MKRIMTFTRFKQSCKHLDFEWRYDVDTEVDKCNHTGNEAWRKVHILGGYFSFKPCNGKSCPEMGCCLEPTALVAKDKGE